MSIHFAAIVLSLVGPVPSQTEAAGLVAQAAPMVGGYSKISAAREDVQEAARFAAGELGIDLASVESAQSKPVAAFLFLLELTGEDGSRWRVEVTKPLRGGTWTIRSSEQLEKGGDVRAQYD